MSRPSLAVLCVTVSLWLNSSAQTFQKLYGDSTVGENGYSLLQTNDGGFLITGVQFNSNNLHESALLIKTDNHGDTIWTRRIREPFVNYLGFSATQTFDRGFAITGIKGDGNNFVPFLLKVDSSGNILWNRSYLWFAQEHMNSIVQTPDSGFLLSGYLYNGDMLVYFIRTDANGDTLWTKSYGENNFNAQVYSLKMASDGGFVAAGTIQDQLTQNADAFIFKTDAAGNFLWAKSYGTPEYEYGQQVETTADGGFILAAVTNGFALAEFLLIKTDSSGNLQWSKTYGAGNEERSESVRQTTDGGYLIGGESSSFAFGFFDNYFVRTDANGDTLWTKTIYAMQSNEGYSMILTNDGGFAVAGNYFAPSFHNDVFFLKADSSGFMGCSEISTNTSVGTPLLNVVSHPMTFYPSHPSVIAHAMEVKSGIMMITMCEDNFIGEGNLSPDIFIYPNPIHSSFNIELKENKNSISQLRIFNMALSEINLPLYFENNKGTIDCANLIPGIYILEINTGREVIHRKMIKQ